MHACKSYSINRNTIKKIVFNIQIFAASICTFGMYLKSVKLLLYIVFFFPSHQYIQLASIKLTVKFCAIPMELSSI